MIHHFRPVIRMALIGLVSWASPICLAQPVAPTPTTEPTTRPKLPDPPKGEYEVYEWVIFVCDPNVPQTNDGKNYRSTMPDFVASRRENASIEKMTDPQPMGVIRFVGTSDKEKVDVLLEQKGGRFVAVWPKPITRTTGVLWQNLEVGAPKVLPPEGLADTYWISALRSGQSSSLLRDKNGENFLLYDSEPNYKFSLKFSPGEKENEYRVSNSAANSVRDLHLYKRINNKWHVATVDELAGTNAAKKPAGTTMPTTVPATLPSMVPATLPVMAPAQPMPATNRAATLPTATISPESADVISATPTTPQPAPVAPVATLTFQSGKLNVNGGGQVVLNGGPKAQVAANVATITIGEIPATKPVIQTTASRPSTTQSSATQPTGQIVRITGTEQTKFEDVIDPLHELLQKQQLPDTDWPTIKKILSKHAMDPTRLTAIYRLDATELDAILPLDITPSPRKTIRVGLVIALNIDPAIAFEIDDLIVQLGDKDWKKRERAQKRLLGTGSAAKAKVEKALTSTKDPEVIARLERIVAALTATPNLNKDSAEFLNKDQ